jgi:hypothetical protein
MLGIAIGCPRKAVIFAGFERTLALTRLFNDPIALDLQRSDIVVIDLAKAMHLLGGDQYGVFHDDPGSPLGTWWLSERSHIGKVSTILRQKLLAD